MKLKADAATRENTLIRVRQERMEYWEERINSQRTSKVSVLSAIREKDEAVLEKDRTLENERLVRAYRSGRSEEPSSPSEHRSEGFGTQ